MSAFKEIKYGTPKHKALLKELIDRRDLSKNKMAEKHLDWQTVDESFQFYIKASDNDLLRKSNRKTKGKLDYVTIDIPYTYAMTMTAHSYSTSIFLARNPIFQFAGRHGEPEMQVQALEALIDYQVGVGKHVVPYFIWLMDKHKYGFGVLGSYWDEEKISVTEYKDLPVTYFGIPVPGKTQRTKTVRSMTSFMGNKVFNVRVYDWYPDVRKPLSAFQTGEFCGHRTEYMLNDLMKGKEDGRYFNIDIVERFGGEGWTERVESSVLDLPTDDGTFSTQYRGSLKPWEGFQLAVELSPERWGLGNSTYPEKWVFEVIHDRVIINARPLGALHNQFPYSIVQHEFDASQIFTRGMMEIGEDLNKAMSWLMNSHFYNVRKVMNDTLVVDPSMIVMKDVTDPGAGKIIRKRPAAYGKDTRLAIHQLQVVDVTQGHVKDLAHLATILQKVLGISENFTGGINPGGRKTASEIRTASAGSVSRQKTHAEYDSALGFDHLARIMVSNTQQYYDAEQTFRLAGDIVGAELLSREISAEDIAGFYDFIPMDGALPLDRFATANLWREFLKDLAALPPQIVQDYDLGKIIAYVMQTAGAKNIQQFKFNVRSDGDIQREALAGNITPAGGQSGQAIRGAIPGRNTGQSGGPGEPGQISGMGSTG